MKKKLSILLTMMMLCTLCTPVTKALADDNAEVNGSVTDTTTQDTSETQTDESAQNPTGTISGFAMDYDTGVITDELTTFVVTTGSEKELDISKLYYIDIPVDTKEIVLPMTLDQKGILNCGTIIPKDWTSIYSDFSIYSDAQCTNPISYSSYDYEAIIPKKGTYYFKFTISDYNQTVPTEGYQIGFFSQFYTGNDKVLKNKTWVCSGNIDTSKPMYYKVTVSKTGSLTINTKSTYSNTITLLNSKKKAISDDVYDADGKVCFVVTKGTYYIKVTGSSSYLRIKSTFAGMNDYSGATKAKARKLTPGKLYTGYVSTADKNGKVDWFKITLTKSQVVNITFTGSASSGSIDLEFYGNGISGSIDRSISMVDSDKSFSAETWTSKKLPKGTYYIKVTKSTPKTSGFYKIRLDK